MLLWWAGFVWLSIGITFCGEHCKESWVPWKTSKILSSWASISFSRRTLLHTVSYAWNKYISLYKLISKAWDKSSEITHFCAIIATNCWTLRSYMKGSYVVGHERPISLSFQCIVSILWIFIIIWCGYLKISIGLLYKEDGLRTIGYFYVFFFLGHGGNHRPGRIIG